MNKKNKDYEKTQQVRHTLEDTLQYQEEFSELFKLVINENRPMRLNERKRLRRIMPKALLSQGAVHCVSMTIEGGFFTFSSLQNMILRVSEVNESLVRLTTHKPSHNVQVGSIAELWKFIYSQLLYLYPLAAAEAIRMSKESQYKVEQESYDFDSTEEI